MLGLAIWWECDHLGCLESRRVPFSYTFYPLVQAIMEPTRHGWRTGWAKEDRRLVVFCPKHATEHQEEINWEAKPDPPPVETLSPEEAERASVSSFQSV